MPNDKNASFQLGNFSCSLKNDLPTKSDFVAMHKGKLTIDINRVYNELKAAKAKFDKQNKPAKSAPKKKDEEKTDD